MTIRHNIPMAEYLAIDAFSSGVAHRTIAQSPLHALHSKVLPRDPSSASNKGEVCHRLLLEGHEDNIVLVDADNWRTKAAQETRAEAYANGQVPLLLGEMEPIRVMVQAAKNFIAQSEIADVFENGRPEVTVEWDEDGLPCKARPDFLSDKYHLSVKTTSVLAGANPASWSRRQLTPMGYDFNLMFYRRGLLANGIDVQHRILVIEQNKPYGCSLIALSPAKAAIAEADVKRSIDIWKQCLADNHFPAYGTATFEAEATPWELAEAEEREYAETTAGGSNDS